MNYLINDDYIIQTLQDLVRINSVNPSLSADGKGEAELGAYIAGTLKKLGLHVNSYELEPNRVNVVGVLKGAGNGRSLLLNAHMDTVGVEGMEGNPFGGDIKNGRLYGRGSQDMKGSIAAMLAVAKAFVDSGVELAGDLLITAVADEEYASLGTEHLVGQVKADAAIVTEPTDMTLCRAHRGFIWYDVETFGRAAHGSRFKEGIDANIRMGRFLAQLDKLEQELRQRPSHPLTGPPSLHAAKLQGGKEISIYAAHCYLQIERRTIPGEEESQATDELQAIIDQLEVEDPSFKASVKPTFERQPFEIGTDAHIVQILQEVMTSQLGEEPVHSGQTYWTDAALLAEAGMETALVGPRGYGLHSAEEWVDLESVVQLANILAETAVNYCQS